MLASALARTKVHGLVTNRDLRARVLRHPAFLSGQIDAGLLDRQPEVFAPLLSSVEAVRLSCLAAALAGAAGRGAGARVQPGIPCGWRNLPSMAQTIVYDGPAGYIHLTEAQWAAAGRPVPDVVPAPLPFVVPRSPLARPSRTSCQSRAAQRPQGAPGGGRHDGPVAELCGSVSA